MLSFLSSFGGILVAFGMDRWWEKRQNNKRRKRALNLILGELKECSIKEVGHLMPTDVWETIVNSGRTMLLDEKRLVLKKIDLFSLTRVYNKIRNLNYEAQGVNRFREAYLQSQGTPDEKRLYKIWDDRSKIFVKSHQQIVGTINEMIKLLEDSEELLTKKKVKRGTLLKQENMFFAFLGALFGLVGQATYEFFIDIVVY